MPWMRVLHLFSSVHVEHVGSFNDNAEGYNTHVTTLYFNYPIKRGASAPIVNLMETTISSKKPTIASPLHLSIKLQEVE